jgi:hypothetical protein
VLVRVAAQHSLEEGRAGGEYDAVRLQPGLAIKNPPKKPTKNVFMGFYKIFLSFMKIQTFLFETVFL